VNVPVLADPVMLKFTPIVKEKELSFSDLFLAPYKFSEDQNLVLNSNLPVSICISDSFKGADKQARCIIEQNKRQQVI